MMRFKSGTANYILRRLTFGPAGHHPVLRWTDAPVDGEHGALTATFRTPDSADRGQLFTAAFQSRSYRYADVQTYEQFFLIVFDAICAFERHELLEGMRFHGSQVWLPHRPGQAGALTNPHSDLFLFARPYRTRDEWTYPGGITEQAADRIVQGITVDGSAVIRVSIQHVTELTASILVEFGAPDSVNPDQRFAGTFGAKAFDYATVRSEEHFYRVVYESVAAFNRHELLEQLRYRGKRVWLAHRPGSLRAITAPRSELFFQNREKQTDIQTQPHEGVTA